MNQSTELKSINGSVLNALLSGACVIWHKYDGFDWHIITKNPSNSEWKFEYHRTCTIEDKEKKKITSTFALMVSYNKTKMQVLKEVTKEFYDSKFHKEDHSDSYIPCKL